MVPMLAVGPPGPVEVCQAERFVAARAIKVGAGSMQPHPQTPEGCEFPLIVQPDLDKLPGQRQHLRVRATAF
jgi:hypothetical protein